MSNNENYQYNRIVIIGNGYDRALGMATSYNDFLLYYLKQCFESAMSAKYCDEVITIEHINYNNNSELLEQINKKNSVSELLEFNINKAKISSKSELLELMLERLERNNWVDIETLYFNMLVLKMEQIKKSDVLKRDFSSIIQLNKVFQKINDELHNYIKQVDNNFQVNISESPIKSLNNKFFDKNQYDKLHFLHNKINDEISDPENILFLNFNYTKSLSKILYYTNKKNYTILHIHGQIDNLNNPIIFGYGDDTHKYYKEIEIEDSFDPMMFIKSFHYNKTENYHTLLDFMSLGKYEVYVAGHSCGLPDRTLLKAIFENEACLAIKIFHRGTQEEHFLKNIAISRHFDDKLSLRKKVMPYDPNAKIPQHTNS
jgi:hypothetical protein